MKFKFLIKVILISIFVLLFSNSNIFAVKPNYDDLYSNNIIVMDSENGAVLFNKYGDKKVYPASTTKIITAIIAIENLELNTPITASKNAIYSTPIGSSSIYLKVGEIMSVKNLLYGLLVKSGNDAANVLAEAVAGDIDTFVDMMNQKVKEIGCKNTNFSNAHGFHEDSHYTTAYDMAKIMQYCMQNETFRTFVETKKVVINETNKTSEKRILVNTNKMFNESYKDMYYEYAIGGKTGYTEEARGTFVGYLKKDDKSIIVSVFDGSQNVSGNEARFLDTIRLSDYIFDDFTKNNILSKDNFNFKIIDKNNKKKYTISLKNDITSLTDNNTFRTNYLVNINNSTIYDDITKNIGKLSIIVKNGDNAFILDNSYDLYITNIEDYNYFNIHEHLNKIIFILILLLAFLTIFYRKSNVKTRNKIKRRKFKDKDLRRINKSF